MAARTFKLAESDAGSKSASQMDIICVLCKQSAEMHLKGFLEARGADAVDSRSLIQILKACETLCPLFSKLEDPCRRLGMYEDMHKRSYEISWCDMEMAVIDANEIRAFVSTLLAGQGAQDDLPF
jgi:HEPN domain-containing protein